MKPSTAAVPCSAVSNQKPYNALIAKRTNERPARSVRIPVGAWRAGLLAGAHVRRRIRAND